MIAETSETMTTVEQFSTHGVASNGHIDHLTNGTSHETIEGAQTLPLFAKANSLLFNSGNIVSTERLKRRTNSNPQDEVGDALNNTLARWMATEEPLKSQESKSIKCRHPEYYEKIKEAERDDMSISGELHLHAIVQLEGLKSFQLCFFLPLVKIFLNSIDPEVLERAIDTSELT